IHAGTSELWSGLPRYIVIMFGGFTTNLLWCILLYTKNKTGHQFLSPTVRRPALNRQAETIIETAIDAPSEEAVERAPIASTDGSLSVPLLRNYMFSALA